jgi:hypothetical protein
MNGLARLLTVVAAICASSDLIDAHAGPPYPIVSDRATGPYVISIWTDPDATDDGTAGGQFWVVIEHVGGKGAIPPQTTARVTARPLDREGTEVTAATAPVRGDVTNQFAALIMDHEGPFAVRVVVSGPLGTATVDAQADATYDLRPARYMLVLYLMPFLLVGALWTRLLLRRRNR